MKKEKDMFQEIFVKLKFSKDTKINKRLFAWRRINFDTFYIKNLSIDENENEVSFTSEFNANFSKDEIKSFISNGDKCYFTTGEGLSLKTIDLIEVVEIKEEAEIYGL